MLNNCIDLLYNFVAIYFELFSGFRSSPVGWRLCRVFRSTK
jgi:hypothetical protein